MNITIYKPRPVALSTPRRSLDGVGTGPVLASGCISLVSRAAFFLHAHDPCEAFARLAFLPHIMRISNTLPSAGT